MKKNVVIIMILVLTLVMSGTIYANDTRTASTVDQLHKITDVKCSVNSNQVEISIIIAAFKGYKIMKFDNPDRIVIDIPNATGPLLQQKINLNSSLVKAVRYAKNNDTTARVVIETVGKPQYSVSEKAGKLVAYIGKPTSGGVNYYFDGSAATLTLPGIKLTKINSGNKKAYSEKYDLGGKRYTLSFPSSLLKLQSKTMKVNDTIVKSIEIVSSAKTKTTSIIFTTKEKYLFKMKANQELSTTDIILHRTAINNRGDEIRPEVNELTGVKYSSNGKDDIVDLFLNSYLNYNIMRLTGENRIVVDIPNVKAPTSEQTINVNSELIKAIRYIQSDNNSTRVVIDTTEQTQYHIEEKSGQLRLTIQSPNYKNITYNNNGDRVYLILDGAKLTEGAETLKLLYSEGYDATGKQYIMTFPNKLADIGSGEMKINDDMLDSIQIIQNENEPTTSIIFNAKDNFIFQTITREVPNDTAITILKPANKADKLVVIDAGHGGQEPGAISGTTKEKDLNLDIAIRVNKLLKSKNIRTYMTREDDSYVGLYERSYIANNLNASLFLCIHNNAYYTAEHGTETLYFPARTNETGFSGERFAQIIQDFLVGSLGTLDRKIKSRPGLVVLKATTMPAALAEIAFMTNQTDRNNLLNEDFRQKAAEALCEAVIKALQED